MIHRRTPSQPSKRFAEFPNKAAREVAQMLSRLWTMARYGIAAKLYLLTAISVAALVVLATASIHFASQTKFAAGRLYREGVVVALGVAVVGGIFLGRWSHRVVPETAGPSPAAPV